MPSLALDMLGIIETVGSPHCILEDPPWGVTPEQSISQGDRRSGHILLAKAGVGEVATEVGVDAVEVDHH